jgi:GntR family transcriptional repressor for pyruvate dehydrogenase complex
MRELLAEIATGELSPGDMLPREVDLVERFGVSRGVIRECIRGLEERGVIAVKHGRGATVTPPEEWAVLDPEVLRAMLDAPGGDELVEEALECQRLLQVEAAGLAAERAGTDDLEELSAALDRMAAEAGSLGKARAATARYRDADLEFHDAVVQASGNRPLERISAPLHRALSAAAQRRGQTAGHAKRQVADHREILAAIAERDAARARTAMERHLSRRRG